MPPADFCALLEEGGGPFAQIILPREVWQEIEKPNHFRVVGTLNDAPFKLALHSNGAGDYFLIISKGLRQAANARVGKMARLTLCADPAGKAVVLPEELLIVLEQDSEAADRFYAFTPGRQRSYAYYVSQPKREETRIKRALEFAEKLKNYELYGDKLKREKEKIKDRTAGEDVNQ